MFNRLAADGLAGKIEECADFVWVNLDIHRGITSRGISRVGRTDVSNFEHHVCEDAIAKSEGDADVLHIVAYGLSVLPSGGIKFGETWVNVRSSPA